MCWFSGMHWASGQSYVTLAWRRESCQTNSTVLMSGFAEAMLMSTADSMTAGWGLGSAGSTA